MAPLLTAYSNQTTMDEIVEDSEPEREDQRRRAEASRKRSSKKRRTASIQEPALGSTATVASHQGRTTRNYLEVIDVSDEEYPVSHLHYGAVASEARTPPDSQSLTSLWTSNASEMVVRPNTPFEEHGASSSDQNDDPTHPCVPLVLEGRTNKPLNDGFVANAPTLRQPATTSSLQESRLPLDLTRFAFQDPLTRKSVNSNVPSVRGSRKFSTSQQVQSQTASRTITKPPPIDIAMEDLTRLLKCVCCDSSWTTRKTAPQKLKHIRSCAKKHQFSNDTIQSLVLNQVGSNLKTSASGNAEDNRSVGHSSRTPIRNTLLEEALHEPEIAPKKRHKRPVVVETIRSLSDTRASILARARLLLDSPPKAQSAVSVSDCPETVVATINNFPVTPSFGESVLARQCRVIPSLLDTSYEQPYLPTQEDNLTGVEVTSRIDLQERTSSHEAIVDRSPSPAKTGGTSLPKAYGAFPDDVSFRATHSVTALDEGTGSEPEEHSSPGFSHSFSRVGNVVSVVSISSESEVVLSPPSGRHKETGKHRQSLSSPLAGTSKKPLEVSSDDSFSFGRHENPSSDFDDDDGVIHFHPDEDFPPIHQSQVQGATPPIPANQILPFPARKPRVSTKGITKTTTNAPRETLKPSSSRIHLSTAQRMAEPPKAIKSRKKKVVEDVENANISKVDMSDEEFFAKLKECIVSDTVLHLRVLCYEPIHFDIFLQRAAELNVSSKALKVRVRTFLDKQAIQHYGYDSNDGKGRTRRRRA